MELKFLKAKIHRAKVTGADLHYEGSISIGPELLDAAGILPHESVQVYNISNGERLETYAIQGEPGEIRLNGAAAWKAKEGDLIIIAAYCWMSEQEASQFKPTVVHVQGPNQITKISK